MIPADGFTAFEIDHYCDPRDDALAYATLDGRVGVVCERCDRMLYNCSCCEFCDQPRCVCEPFSRREYRAMYARADAGPERYRP